MLRGAGGLLAGLVFGTGLVVSGMINPAKVMGFLDLAGAWDASLAFVMLGAVVATALGYRLVLRRQQPLFETHFSLPTRRDIDAPLLLGAALFGIGWGLAGYCPGPALAGLTSGQAETIAFVIAMLAGMIIARRTGGYVGGLRFLSKSSI